MTEATTTLTRAGGLLSFRRISMMGLQFLIGVLQIHSPFRLFCHHSKCFSSIRRAFQVLFLIVIRSTNYIQRALVRQFGRGFDKVLKALDKVFSRLSIVTRDALKGSSEPISDLMSSDNGLKTLLSSVLSNIRLSGGGQGIDPLYDSERIGLSSLDIRVDHERSLVEIELKRIVESRMNSIDQTSKFIRITRSFHGGDDCS